MTLVNIIVTQEKLLRNFLNVSTINPRYSIDVRHLMVTNERS